MLTARYVKEHKSELIGKRGRFMWTGMMVSGTIREVEISEFSATIFYDMDEPHVWGDDTYLKDIVWSRLEDNFGPLSRTEIDWQS